jgi:hypothetical protein
LSWVVLIGCAAHTTIHSELICITKFASCAFVATLCKFASCDFVALTYMLFGLINEGKEGARNDKMLE